MTRTTAQRREAAAVRQGVRFIGSPEPGYFKLKLVRNGPWMAARIARAKGGLVATVGKTSADVGHVWTYGREIDRTEYRRIMSLLGTVSSTDPIDLNRMEPLL